MKLSLGFKSRLAQFPGPAVDPGARPDAPILQMARVYCILAAGAAGLLALALYLDSRLWNEIRILLAGLVHGGPGVFANLRTVHSLLMWTALLLIGAVILYGFKIARHAAVDARKSAELLQEAKQRTMEIAALYDTSQDVSAHTDLPGLLRTILERAKTLLGAAGCAIFLYDAEKDDFEITSEVGVGMPVGTHIPRHEGLSGRAADTLAPVIVNDYPHWPYRSKALQKLPISAAVCVPMVRSGKFIGVLGVHEVGDTDRVFTEADARLLSLFADNAAAAVQTARLLDALRSSEERFRIAAECASDIVYDWDLINNRVDYFGPAAEKARLHGAPLVGTRQEYWGMIHPEDRSRVQTALKNHFETGAPFSEEYRILNSTGSVVNVADRATAIRNQQGRPVRLIGAVSDITARKRAEQMKSDFVSFVTHQLRTPLSGIKWMLELAMDAADDPDEAHSYLRDAAASTDRLIGLVNDLLDISRLERGKLQVNLQDIHLGELTRSVADEISPLVHEKGQELSIQAADDLPRVSADPQMLRQAVLNLISNAVKYTPKGGRITIRIRPDQGRLRWEVQDTGIGIPKGDVGKLFEKFYRARNASAVETEGTGLGLYLVRLIVERFGGDVSCESEEGKGSTFAFTIPIVS